MCYRRQRRVNGVAWFDLVHSKGAEHIYLCVAFYAFTHMNQDPSYIHRIDYTSFHRVLKKGPPRLDCLDLFYCWETTAI
jgi:hypothetical protein